ncbi:glycosyltransferase [Rhodococcus sp. 1R11]|uniref:glycosyltransferase family 2 protein n=1 Tax=Rhodococcus sp. 1R11 TaxID=2559614 RepID=UPI001071BA79|nr:glycosyltransferase family 2 protein [Rhodococcus sp. 1R11]TFI41891.1 glycosyltransferase [Rhodococcus sp. 1R11]
MNTLSVVIPVLDEVDHIGECLNLLLDQGDDIDRIVVVDNGSTDGTLELVETLCEVNDKVQLVHEPNRGVVHARNTGFDLVKSSIIGRIDADTRVQPGWARSIVEFFGEHVTVAAAGGRTYLYESPWAPLLAWQHARAEQRDPSVRSALAVSGNNFAIRTSAWHDVRDVVSDKTCVHEDIDLCLSLVGKKLPVAQNGRMKAAVSGRRSATSPVKYVNYAIAGYRSYKEHGLASAKLARIVAMDWLLHTLRWPISRMFSAVPSRALPVDDRALSDERMREAA